MQLYHDWLALVAQCLERLRSAVDVLWLKYDVDVILFFRLDSSSKTFDKASSAWSCRRSRKLSPVRGSQLYPLFIVDLLILISWASVISYMQLNTYTKIYFRMDAMLSTFAKMYSSGTWGSESQKRTYIDPRISPNSIPAPVSAAVRQVLFAKFSTNYDATVDLCHFSVRTFKGIHIQVRVRQIQNLQLSLFMMLTEHLPMRWINPSFDLILWAPIDLPLTRLYRALQSCSTAIGFSTKNEKRDWVLFNEYQVGFVDRNHSSTFLALFPSLLIWHQSWFELM